MPPLVPSPGRLPSSRQSLALRRSPAAAAWSGGSATTTATMLGSSCRRRSTLQAPRTRHICLHIDHLFLALAPSAPLPDRQRCKCTHQRPHLNMATAPVVRLVAFTQARCQPLLRPAPSCRTCPAGITKEACRGRGCWQHWLSDAASKQHSFRSLIMPRLPCTSICCKRPQSGAPSTSNTSSWPRWKCSASVLLSW